jgi:hypothetical protein
MPTTPRRLIGSHLPGGVRDLARRLRAGASEQAPPQPAPATQEPVGSDARAAEEHAGERLLSNLIAGKSLTAGLVAEVEARLAAEDFEQATAISAALENDPATRDVGALCFGLVAAHRGFARLAWQKLSATPVDLWSRYAADELVRAGLQVDWPGARAMVESLVETRPAHMGPRLWMSVLEPVYGAGDFELASRLFELVDESLAEKPDRRAKLAVKRDWISRWITRAGDSPTAPSAGDVSFAVVDYDHPGRKRASANIGDHVQTIASVGHLVRHRDIGLQGPQALLDLLEQLRRRVRPDRALRGHKASVQVLTVDRDATSYNEVPENTWVLAFGWYMHALFGVRYGFPMHHNLLPIFISFHCNKRDLLTDDAIAYLRKYGPVGCRDWTTVDVLLSMDVPAFFSGCLTTTIDTVFPDVPGGAPAGAPVAYVDIPEEHVPPEGVIYKHSSDQVRVRSFIGNMYETLDRLETYRRDHSAVVTSRLHCYLPMRSIGSQVDFQPENRSNIRFAGLADITDDEFDNIRSSINDRLASVFDAILDKADPEQVYALWRELSAPDVARAIARREAVTEAPATHNALDDEVARAVATTTTVGPAGREPGTVDVVVPIKTPRADVLQTMLGSLVAHSSRPLHIWLMARGRRELDLGALADQLPGTRLSVVPTKAIGADLRAVTGRRGRIPDLDVLLTPRLLPEAERVVVLPLHSLVRADVTELADLDLEGHGFAAPDEAGALEPSGFGVIYEAAERLGNKTAVSTELRRQAHARNAFDFPAFDVDVLVLDCAALRADDYLRRADGLIEECGLDAREVLHLAAGPRRARVPERWHLVPSRAQLPDAALLHWKDAKPWAGSYAPMQYEWWQARRDSSFPAAPVRAGDVGGT